MTATDVTITSVEQLEAMTYGLPCDMHDEIVLALTSGSEAAIEYRCSSGRNAEAVHYCYFPQARRGGVCAGGDSDWTDCWGLDDLEDRWENYEERWTN